MDAATIGPVALWAALLGCVISLLAAAISRRRVARRGLVAAVLFAIVSCVALTVALLSADFSLEYVARTTSLATPVPYRLAALWGAMEGSLLFYATLTLAIGAVASRRLPDDLRAVTTPVLALVGGGLLLLTALMAYPFEVLAIPAVDGEGLLAILQHPAMVYHPPILYIGLTSLVVPFAITVGAVKLGRVDRDWIRLTRRWLLVSWTFLTFGIVAGANWAYVELGWGGFWAWDPVENTSLMPWLAATVFLHTSRVQVRDGRLARWNVGFALLPFTLTILGVYLTRSGVTGSVHAFAESEVIGRVLLTFALVVAGVVIFLAIRTPPGPKWHSFHALGRDTWLGGHGALVAIALGFVLIGSAYPAYLFVFAGDRTIVASGFYKTTLLPIALVLLVGMALGFKTSWSGSASLARPALTLFALTLLGIGGAAIVYGWGTWLALTLLGLAGATVALLIVDIYRDRPSGRLLGGHLAHVGMALVLVGAGGSSLGDEFRGSMASGDTVEVGGYEVTLDAIETGEADRFIYVAAELSLARSGDNLETLSPQLRAYEEQPLPIPEPALRTTPSGDVVVAISRVADDASVVEVRVFVRPLVLWVWAGGLLIALSGLLSLVSTGGVFARRRRPATAAQQEEGTTTGS